MSTLPHILLVEDNQDDYEAAMRSLQRNLLLNPVQWCRNGQEAMDFLQKKGNYANDTIHPSLVLLDLNMPGMDGRQVLEQIKADPELKSIPVVILTTSADSKDVELCYAAGASTYIQKPVSFEGLTEALRTMKEYWFGIAILPKRSE
jgi:CheY-like chemotaxis protein